MGARCAIASLAFLLTGSGVAGAQERGAAALGSALQGLGVNTRVLIIGAHPDDEDTQVITWLSRGRHVETAYLSLTRGDGGQNIIGNELGEALGVIRTEELLAARRVDGGKQFFTRAYDYGFSKNAEEAFTQWPHDSLLRDVITIVRAYKPHVIISVFSGTPRDGHGQHQAAGILAREAYEMSGDANRFPANATAGQRPWAASKFYRGASNPARRDSSAISFNVGEYDPLLGRSYAEIAAISRSQHRSQAFGSLQPLGFRLDYLQREHSRVPAPTDPRAERSMFDGMDTTWARFRDDVTGPVARAALDSLPAAFVAARNSFSPFEPERSIHALARIKSLLSRMCPMDMGPPCARTRGSTSTITDAGYSAALASGRVDHALALAAGVAVEATLPRELWSVGQRLPIRPVVYNRGKRPVTVVQVEAHTGGTRLYGGSVERTVGPDSSAALEVFDVGSVTPQFETETAPYWLEKPRQGAMYDFVVSGANEQYYARGAALLLQLKVDSVGFNMLVPVIRRFADPVLGEIRRPPAGVPAVSLLLDQALEYAPARMPIERRVRVTLETPDTVAHDVRLELRVPAGLIADSSARTVRIPAGGSKRTVEFLVRGQLPAGSHAIDVVAVEGSRSHAHGYETIDYEHINPRRIYRQSRLTIEAVDIASTSQMRVGYIQGVGDNSAPALEQLGIAVTKIDPATLGQASLGGYTAIVIGPRAYESIPALVANNARLLDYARAGGTLVVQYGQYEMQQPGIMPYPVTINRPHDRVTNENAPVSIIDSSAAILRAPNRITPRDFDGWIQDRSLYMPRVFDPAYTAVLEMSDPGEAARQGALLIAPLGQGTYVYTTLAFFRQLPNGVPGAARLFLNLLAAKANRPAQ